MASGFIILRDGRCLSVRRAIHDAVLRSIAAALQDATPLRAWLFTQIPSETDVELGHAFVRASNREHVSRELDTRGLTSSNLTLFERAAREAEPIGVEQASIPDVAAALERLRQMLDYCDEGRPALELSDWTTDVPPCKIKIGPGW